MAERSSLTSYSAVKAIQLGSLLFWRAINDISGDKVGIDSAAGGFPTTLAFVILFKASLLRWSKDPPRLVASVVAGWITFRTMGMGTNLMRHLRDQSFSLHAVHRH